MEHEGSQVASEHGRLDHRRLLGAVWSLAEVGSAAHEVEPVRHLRA